MLDCTRSGAISLKDRAVRIARKVGGAANINPTLHAVCRAQTDPRFRDKTSGIHRQAKHGGEPRRILIRLHRRDGNELVTWEHDLCRSQFVEYSDLRFELSRET